MHYLREMSVAGVGVEVLTAGNNNGNVTASTTADDFASVATIEGTLRGQSIIKGKKVKVEEEGEWQIPLRRIFFEVTPSTSPVSGVFPINLDHWASHIVGVYSHSGTAHRAQSASHYYFWPPGTAEGRIRTHIGQDLVSTSDLALTTMLCCFSTKNN